MRPPETCRKWYEGFATEISPAVRPSVPHHEYQGRSKTAGRQLLEYRFSSAVDGCFPFLYVKPSRDHGPSGFSVWMAGGGAKGGTAYGATDDIGFKAVGIA
jgi:uncharacterized protein DUF1501